MRFYTSMVIDKIWLNHNVISLKLMKPYGFKHLAGQAVDVKIKDKMSAAESVAPFTLVNNLSESYLELVFRVYNRSNGFTKQLSLYNKKDSIEISEPWDSFIYNGHGVFIAGGTGITPFLSFLRNGLLNKSENNIVIFSNSTKQSSFLVEEFKEKMDDAFIAVYTREKGSVENIRVNEVFLSKILNNEFDRRFYLCGPDNFVEDISKLLKAIGVNSEDIIVSQ